MIRIIATSKSILALSWCSFSSAFSFSLAFCSWLFGGGTLLFFFCTLSFFPFFSWSSIFSWFSLLTSSFGLLFNHFLSNFYYEIAFDFAVEIITESALNHFGCLAIDFNFVNFDFGLLGYPIESPFSFFFLYFEGNTLDWSLLNSLHEMGSKACDFISQRFSGYFSDF